MISGKFAITLHILSLLTKNPESFLSSEFISSSLNMNPVLVRKEIANLKKNKIVESSENIKDLEEKLISLRTFHYKKIWLDFLSLFVYLFKIRDKTPSLCVIVNSRDRNHHSQHLAKAKTTY